MIQQFSRPTHSAAMVTFQRLQISRNFGIHFRIT